MSLSLVPGSLWIRSAAIGGMVAPILFTILVLVTGLLTPGFNQFSQTISELGQVGQPYAVVQDTNFVLTGLLIMGFVIALWTTVLPSRGSKTGPDLLLAYPLAFVLVGTIFPLPSPVHVPLGSVGFFVTLVGMVVTSWPMRRDNSWNRYGGFTLWVAIVAIVAFFVYGFLQSQGVLTDWLGLAQRLTLTPYFFWIEVVAIRLFSVTRNTAQMRRQPRSV